MMDAGVENNSVTVPERLTGSSVTSDDSSAPEEDAGRIAEKEEVRRISKVGVPPGWRGDRRPVRGGAGPCVETRGPRRCLQRRPI